MWSRRSWPQNTCTVAVAWQVTNMYFWWLSEKLQLHYVQMTKGEFQNNTKVQKCINFVLADPCKCTFKAMWKNDKQCTHRKRGPGRARAKVNATSSVDKNSFVKIKIKARKKCCVNADLSAFVTGFTLLEMTSLWESCAFYMTLQKCAESSWRAHSDVVLWSLLAFSTRLFRSSWRRPRPKNSHSLGAEHFTLRCIL